MDDILTEYKVEDLIKRRMDKRSKKRRSKDKSGKKGEDGITWKKKSIFFELPYWEFNLIHHNLDVMHIEKNVYDNILWTLLGNTKNSKDNLKACRDLEEMNIRKPLHPKLEGGNKLRLPPACFSMNNEEKNVFLKVLKEVKVPNGYASNIS